MSKELERMGKIIRSYATITLCDLHPVNFVLITHLFAPWRKDVDVNFNFSSSDMHHICLSYDYVDLSET